MAYHVTGEHMRWNIDAAHSIIEFGVKHLGISTTRGRFGKAEGFVEMDEKDTPTSLQVTIDAGSIDTNQADRDKHLRSADFFDVERFPTITFRSTVIRQVNDDEYEIIGQLSMHGIARPVTFRAEVEPVVKTPWGDRRKAGVASGKLNRKDWGLVWNQVLETGGLLVGEEVRFNLEVELVAVPAAEEAAV